VETVRGYPSVEAQAYIDWRISMDRTRFASQLADLPVEQAVQPEPQPRCHRAVTHHSFALAVAGLAAFAAVACLPAPMPGTASRAAGFPTGDPPPIPREFGSIDEIETSSERAIDVLDACFDPFDIAMP